MAANALRCESDASQLAQRENSADTSLCISLHARSAVGHELNDSDFAMAKRGIPSRSQKDAGKGQTRNGSDSFGISERRAC